MKNRKQTFTLLLSAITLGLTNMTGSYAFVHAQETSTAPPPVIQTSASDIYDENGNLLINETTFPDPYFREYIIQEVSGGSDRFTQEQLQNVKIIDCAYSALESIKGIEYFPNLYRLCCNNTNLKEIDLSNNKELTMLDVSDTKIRVLELKHNKKLQNLKMFHPGLMYINLEENRLSSYEYFNHNSTLSFPSSASEIDLTKLYPGLDPTKIAKVENAEIHDGIVSNFEYGKTIKIDYPYMVLHQDDMTYSTSYFKTGFFIEEVKIDDENFPDKAFQAFIKQYDENFSNTITHDEAEKITTMDLQGDTAIQNLKGIEFFHKLQALDCSNTNIRQLDVSQNTDLEKLNISNTPLEVLDLSNNKQLSSLQAANTNLAYFHFDQPLDENNLNVPDTSNITLYASASELDVTKLLPGIDITNIKIIHGADFEQGILRNFTYDNPVLMNFTYRVKDTDGKDETNTLFISPSKKQLISMKQTSRIHVLEITLNNTIKMIQDIFQLMKSMPLPILMFQAARTCKTCRDLHFSRI